MTSSSGVLRSEMLRRSEIQRLIVDLSPKVDAAYDIERGEAGELIILGVLHAALYFAADLSRELFTPNHVEFIRYRSMNGQTRGEGEMLTPILELDGLAEKLVGHDVLIADTICDTGATLAAVHSILSGYHPRSLRTCALLWRKTAPKPDFYAYEMEGTEFVYGYGLDLDGERRHIPTIKVVGVD